MCFLRTLRCSCVPPFIPLYPLLHHPPLYFLMGGVALTLFHLRIPHSVNPSSFTPWLQDSLWDLFLLLLSLSCVLSLISLTFSHSHSLSLWTLLVSYLRETLVFTNGLASKPTPSEPPLIPFRLWRRFTVTD